LFQQIVCISSVYFPQDPIIIIKLRVAIGAGSDLTMADADEDTRLGQEQAKNLPMYAAVEIAPSRDPRSCIFPGVLSKQ
jgi:hypothetical protein